MSMKRARTNSYSDYNVVSYQSQPMGGTFARPFKKRTLPVNRKKGRKDPLSKKIDSAISRRLENKSFVNYGANQSLMLAGLTLAPAQVYLLPEVAQGFGSNARIGNEIKIRSGVLTLAINTTQYAATAGGLPTNVRVLLVSSKVTNDNTISSIDANTFFQIGNTDADFQGTMLDMLLPVNTDQYTVYYDKIIKLGMANGVQTAGNFNMFDNSSAQQVLTIDWGQWFKSPLKYQDGTPNYPQNRNLHVLLQWCRVDGGTATQGDVAAEYHFTNVVKYEDA